MIAKSLRYSLLGFASFQVKKEKIGKVCALPINAIFLNQKIIAITNYGLNQLHNFLIGRRNA